MTKTCVICKKESNPEEDSRSFHKFPKDEVLKQKWMIAIGITSISSISCVCSDHFTNESYHQTDGYTTLKRLLSNAVPNIIKNPKVPVDDTITVAKSTNKDDINTKSEDRATYTEVLRDIIHTVAISTNEGDINSKPREKMKNSRIEINNRKRPYPFTIKDLTNKKFRFKDGVQTEYIEKKDFVSDNAWERFLKFMIYKNNLIAVARNKHLRKHKKIENLTTIIEKLEKMENFAAAKYLEVFK